MTKQARQRRAFLRLFQLQNGSRGITVVEILVAVAITGLVFSSILGGTIFILRQAKEQEEKAEALALAQEGLEAVRSFRDSSDWGVDGLGSLSLGTYALEISGSPARWNLIPGTETINGFEREVLLEEALRDGLSNIVSTGGTVDPNSKMVTVRVSWSIYGDAREVELTSLFTNWKE